MQLSSIQNNPNFTSTKISSVKIKRVVNGVVEFIDVNLTKLDSSDKNAASYVGIRPSYWNDAKNTDYYAIEIPDADDSTRILGMAKVTEHAQNEGNYNYLSGLVTREVLSYGNKNRSIHGIGTVLFGAICSMTSKIQGRTLQFLAGDYNFFVSLFQKAKINPAKISGGFCLTGNHCKAVASTCEENYGHFHYEA